ncbi:peptidase [Nitrospira sp. KM1]|uniref:penicillin acylase family protein n=1 Tax=Nitrospira sp. KM1 TaxID=1936990 RepID=UPI0013A7AEAB|nr:penicillin acylase family protein [Nitrospira sp. KM1]BCA53914.1 peptidase [Nitrospira sp. KM1]
MRTSARITLVAGVVAGLAVGSVIAVLRASLPTLDGVRTVQGLVAPAAVQFDQLGVPTVTADSKADALRALGYVSAQDRLFQMDLARRGSAGRLAEVFGETVVAQDVKQRRLGLSQAADRLLPRLPKEQLDALDAYAEGVNAYLTQMTVAPFEFLLLGYRPEPWRPADSLLVVLAMFQMLNGYEDDERMRTVMKASLPADVTEFLIPSIDPYTAVLLRDSIAQRPPASVPVRSLAALRRPVVKGTPMQASMVAHRKRPLGSNAWAVAGSKTTDGRAILANDMHLDMTVPNMWYRVQLRYGRVDMAGIVVPGIPVMISGSNGAISWGMTNVEGDFLDLVRVELDERHPNHYVTADGSRPFTVRRETIIVRNGRPHEIDVKETIWGPLAADDLMGQPVAVRWTALDPEAVDLGLMHMDEARSLPEAMRVANRAGGPPNNVILADSNGHIGWTYMGRIPLRRGFDGSVSMAWTDGRTGWEGFLPPDELPRIVDPPAGFLVSANHRMTGDDFGHVVGHSFVNGYRAYRITERLQTMDRVRESDLFTLQLDTRSALYEFYRDVVDRVLTDTILSQKPNLVHVRHAVDAWDGRADVDSKGFGVLVVFRRNLASSVFAPFLETCRERDARFVYDGDLDTPLRTLLNEQPPELLPDPEHHESWSDFLLSVLERTVSELKTADRVADVEAMTWGQMNRIRMAHPLAEAIPLIGMWLNMPEEDAAGCAQCIRVISDGLAASERMVVSPAQQQDGIFHMPGGQSGHPLSPHYRDQQRYWSRGIALPLLSGAPMHRLILSPSTADGRA